MSGLYCRLLPTSERRAQLIATLHRTGWWWAELVEALDRLTGGGLRVALERLDVVAGATALADMHAGWVCGLAAGAGDLGIIHLSNPVAQSIAAQVLGVEDPAEVEVRPLLALEGAALEGLFSHLLASLHVGIWTRRVETATGANLPETVYRVGVRVETGPMAGQLTAWLSPDRWDALVLQATPAFGRPGAARHEKLAGLKWPVRLRLALFEISSAGLAVLRPGDVLMPGAWAGTARPGAGALLLGARSLTAVALEWSAGIAIRAPQSGDEQEETPMSDGGGGEKAGSAAQIETGSETVTVELVVGELSLSLGEAMELRPGRVLQLAETLDEVVDLVVGGRVIGRGRLVEVEGRLGVQVEALHAP